MSAAVRTLLVSIALLITACSAPAESNPPLVAALDGDFDRDTLIVENSDGSRHTFEVYLALSDEQHKRGLMFVRELPANVGMLFVYDSPGMRSMWMKNTFIPLDLVYARGDGTVSSIIHDTVPLSLASRGAVEPISFVLELNAGTSRRLGIERGSRIIWTGPAD